MVNDDRKHLSKVELTSLRSHRYYPTERGPTKQGRNRSSSLNKLLACAMRQVAAFATAKRSEACRFWRV
jgi:hypothetical protein